MESPLPTIHYGFLTQDFPSHEHRLWEIHLFTGGVGSLIQGAHSWTVSAGSLTLSPPGAVHSLTVERALVFYFVQFDDREVAALVQRLVDRQLSDGPLRVEGEGIAEVGRLKVKLDSPSVDRVASGLHGFRSWLYDLAVPRPESQTDGVDTALVWLRQNLDRRLSLDELASVARMDRSTFTRRFRVRTALSPLAYVHRSKVEAASFLLAGTDLSLGEVAVRFGFSDEFHFGKIFKKWRGVSPGRWRRDRSPISPGSSWP